MKNLKRHLFGIALIGSILTVNVAHAYDDEFDAIPSADDAASYQEPIGSLDEIASFDEDYSLILSEYIPSVSTASSSQDHLGDDWIDYLNEDYSQILNLGSF